MKVELAGFGKKTMPLDHALGGDIAPLGGYPEIIDLMLDIPIYPAAK
ncbi:MAG: hypothetical protein IT297_00965 [Anaerolineae bacterium]|nr:hypothetical protein [Anaerolineae bacterium]